MKKYISSHVHYYLVFGFLQIIGFLSLLALSGHKDIQMVVIVVSSIAYMSWAILHHYLDHSLTGKIVLEYVVFGLFGIVLSLFYFK